ncbi:MAG: hypothetical protein RL755_23 [Pseudomonadota bacterium]|jgi:hypothetical protein
MTIKKVDDLTIDELNQAVAFANGLINSEMFWLDNDNQVILQLKDYTPCTDQAQAYEIIEREKISLNKFISQDEWNADIFCFHVSTGETPLIAAMRCYVKSKLGYKIDL